MNTHRAASARVTVPAPVRRWLYGIAAAAAPLATVRSEEHTSELQSRGHLVCRPLLEKKKTGSATRNFLRRQTWLSRRRSRQACPRWNATGAAHRGRREDR